MSVGVDDRGSPTFRSRAVDVSMYPVVVVVVAAEVGKHLTK